jgi:translation initiation factor 1
MPLFTGTPFDRPPHCPRCDKLEAECTCPPEQPVRKPLGKQTARIAVERRKGGKTVTVIRGLTAADNDLPALLTSLKNHCGSGGTLHEEELELQGDQIARAKAQLEKIGYRVKG